MLKYKTLLLVALLSFNANANAEKIWLNELNCVEFSSQEICNNLNASLSDLKLNSYEAMTFDNQLKKITFFIRNKKEDIAKKRYKIFLDSAYDTLNKDNATFLMQYETEIWDILNNYSKSDYYTSNPNYKL